MPKYDAFGREIGEDSLESLGWSSGGAVTPSPPPAPAPAPATETPPPPGEPPAAVFGTPPPSEPPSAVFGTPPPAAGPPRPRPTPAFQRRPRRRHSGGARIMSRLISFAIIAGIAAAVIPSVSSRVKDATDGIKIDIPDVQTPSLPKTETAKPPVGLGPRSLIRPAAFSRALRDVRGRRLGRLTNLSIRPERIDLQTVRNGRLTSSQFSTAGGFRKFSTSGPGFSGTTTIPWGKLDPAAPQRLVRAAAERIHKPVSKINYLVAFQFDGTVSWGAYFKGGQVVQGDARGKVTRRIQ
jgi:hypothetical protein